MQACGRCRGSVSSVFDNCGISKTWRVGCAAERLHIDVLVDVGTFVTVTEERCAGAEIFMSVIIGVLEGESLKEFRSPVGNPI